MFVLCPKGKLPAGVCLIIIGTEGILEICSRFYQPETGHSLSLQRANYSVNIITLRMLSWTERSSFVVGVSCYDASSPLVPARQFKHLV